jgi:hypothetical protein
MKKLSFQLLAPVLLVLGVTIHSPAFAQTEALEKTIRATNIQELLRNRPNFVGGNMIYGIPDEPKRLLGNYYLDPKWNKATLMLYKEDKIIPDRLVRYNIASNQFEVIAPGADEVTTIPGLRVQNLVWIDSVHQVPRYFVNGMDYKEEGVPVSGFYEVLVDGELPLVRRTVASVKRSNYNTALMVGNKNDEIKKKNIYYYVVDGEVMEVPRKRKQLIKVFEDKADEVQRFMEESQVNLKDNSGLYMVFSYYNSLFEGYDPLWPEGTD